MKGSPWEWTSLTLAGLALVLVIANSVLFVRNQAIQFEVNQRQQVINQGLQLARIRQVLAQLLAQAQIAHNDRELSDLLVRHGITVSAAPANPPPAAAPGK